MCGVIAWGVFLACTLPPGAPAAAGTIILNIENPLNAPVAQPYSTTSCEDTSCLLIRNASGITFSAYISGRPDKVIFSGMEGLSEGRTADGHW
jgi:hypothetical protein